MERAVDDLKSGDVITLPHRPGRCTVKQVTLVRSGVDITYAHKGRRYTERFSLRDRVNLAEQQTPSQPALDGYGRSQLGHWTRF